MKRNQKRRAGHETGPYALSDWISHKGERQNLQLPIQKFHSVDDGLWAPTLKID
jgi:hypothetical protein